MVGKNNGSPTFISQLWRMTGKLSCISTTI